MKSIPDTSNLILLNGVVHNPRVLDEHHSGIAISGDRIMAVGSDDEMLSFKTPKTEIYDLSGRFILPGFTDSHIHLEKYSLQLDQVDCDTTSLEECLERVRTKVEASPEGQWIRGHGWNQNNWGGYGTAQQLDAVSPANPVFLTAKSLHAGWGNSRALTQCNINSSTPDLPRGPLQRDKDGKPTGILFEDSIRLITDHIPHPTQDELSAAISRGQKQLLDYGITTIHDFDGANCLSALQRLRNRGELVLRVLKHIREDGFEAALDSGMATGQGDNKIRIGNLKLFADGALGPQTAAMLQPYLGTDGGTGMLTEDRDSILFKGRRAAKAGIGLAVHAIGDQVNRQVLDALEILVQEQDDAGRPRLPYRMEHLQLMDPLDIHRPAEIGITASMQPIHATSDMSMADRYWGDRVRTSYAWKAQLDSGALLIFGSDAPVESPNPFLGLHAAVTRQRVDGSPGMDGWVPEERISLDEALYAYTYAPQLAAGWGDELGILRAGYLADLVVLGVDPRHIPAAEIFEVLPDGVMAAGKWVVNSGFG